VSAFQDVKDEQEAQEIELSENVAEDFVRYFRGNVVGHEEQGWLMYLGLLSGWAYDDGCHTNTIGIGPPGSGKSLTKNTVETLFDAGDKYTKTDASSNAILDSVEWDLSLIAPLDEIDKIDKAITEVLKSSNPVDDGYSKDRNVEDPDARGGYSPTEVSADANPWILLYAPTSKKGGIDDELEDRALVLYFSNDKHTRRGIMRKEFGHENIDTSNYDDEYIYDTQQLSARLRQHIRDLPVRNHYEEDEDGEEYLASRSGDTLVYMPRWVVYVCEPIFNIDEDYTNRVFGIVNNLIRASALLNHENRAHKDVEVYVDEDSTETEDRDAVVVEPQDVANVLSCLPTLLSTTHQLTPLKRHILDAVDATEPMTDGDGTTVQDVRGWLDDNDIPHPSESTLRDRLDALAENYYLQKWENAGGKKGTANVYERHDEGALQTPNVYDLQRHADRDGQELASEDCVTLDPEDPFADVTDPIREQPFKETVQEFEQQFSGSDVEEQSTDAADFMGGSSDSESADSESDSGGQAALTDVSDDGVEEATADTDGSGAEDIDLDPKGELENPTEQYVFKQLQDQDGAVFGGNHDVTHFIGAVGSDQHSASVDMTETAVNPEHELWDGRPDLRDDRVMSEPDALRELSDAYGDLKQKGFVVEDDDGGPPAMFCLRVAETEP